jgi:hypothetical protein
LPLGAEEKSLIALAQDVGGWIRTAWKNCGVSIIKIVFVIGVKKQ